MFSQKNFLHFNVVIVPITTGSFLITFLIIQFLGERLNFSPDLYLSSPGWLHMHEAILVFVLILAISQVIALNITFYLIKKIEVKL